MVEIGGKPILWHIMKLYSHYGYNDFILALGYKGNIIRDYFLNYFYYNNDITVNLGNEEKTCIHNNHKEQNWKVTLVDTGQDSMTGYRVKLAGKHIYEDKFMLTYGDAVANVNIKELVEFHKTKNTIGTITGVFPPSRFGDLKVKEDNTDIIDAFSEKAKVLSDDRMINGGFFIFKKEFLDILPNDPLCDLERKPLENLVEKKQLSVYRHTDFWQCMDTYRDFVLLNNLWLKDPKWKLWNK
jgi:glucose-1-phosphate cytidylyltransferase